MRKPVSMMRQATLGAALAACGLFSAAHAQTTINAVMHSPLRVLDPIITTAHITRNHGYMIYDTLLATDAEGKIHPQMVEGWEVSDEGRTYTFKLRPGQKWHDGGKVTAEDCVASIKRWSSQDKQGQLLFAQVADMKALDEDRFSITMKEPSSLALLSLAKPSGLAPFMMPKRLAETPSTQAITEHIGSGPFRMVTAEFKPGLQVVYEKNPDYVPRAEPASGLAGGKQVHVDRVKWIATPDAMTAVNALVNGEIDYLEQLPLDLEPIVEASKDVKIHTLDAHGYQVIMRMNHLHPPFDNKLIRQAAMNAVGQEPILQARVGNPKYYSTCAALFGCGTALDSQAGAGVTVGANIEKAKELLKQANYDGTPVVLLQPTDTPTVNSHPIVIAQALRKAGFKVDMQAMDWQTVVTRRAVQAPPKEGGWNIFATNNVMPEAADPLRAFAVAANGKQAWFGWPDVPEIEKLRVEFAKAADDAKRKELADRIQTLVVEEGVVLPLGQYFVPTAYRTNLSGALESPVPVFWNIKKQ